MRQVERITGSSLKLAPEEKLALGQWLVSEHDYSDSAYRWIREAWMDELRMYNGWPRNMTRLSPREDAPNLEITLGALATDVISAQFIDLYFQVSPALTVRPRTGFDDIRKAYQVFLDWMVAARIGFRRAVDNYTVEVVGLGTSIYYCPWKETVRKTDSIKVTDAGPEMLCWPIEYVTFPPNPETDIQKMRWVTLRMDLTKSDILLRKDRDGWDADFSKMQPTNKVDEVRQRRLELAKQQNTDNSSVRGENYDIRMTWALRDVDGDYVDEDLTVVWERNSGHVLKAVYNEYDLRPLALGQYQIRAHLPVGIGVLGMSKPYEEEVTDIHSQRTDNMFLVNNRAWKAVDAIADSLSAVWPGKVVSVTSMEDVGELLMADVYPSSVDAEKTTVSYWERRVGMTELAAPSKLGGRTPGVTAMTALQKANQRFTPALDNHRNTTAEAVIQCLYRYQERLRLNDPNAMNDVNRVFGKVEGGATLKAKFLDSMLQDVYSLRDQFDVFITASSVTINRMQDQQAYMQLSQIYEKYIMGEVQSAQMLDGPAKPGTNLHDVIIEGREAMRALMKRIVYTFTQISDWNQFVLDVEPQEQQALALPAQATPDQAGNAFAQLGAPPAPNGAIPPPISGNLAA